MNAITFTPERKAMLTEDIRFEALEMVNLLEALQGINDNNEEFFYSVKQAFEHLIETQPGFAPRAFRAYSTLTSLFRVAALRQRTLDSKITEYQEIIKDCDVVEENGGSLVKFKAAL
jgi:hypothetical protein